jgi:hypothetical protein
MKGSPIDSFFVALGFDVDDKAVLNFQQHLEHAKLTALAFGAAIVGLGVGLATHAAHVADEVDALGDFAEQEQVSVEAIQEFGHAAQLSGSSIESVKSSIEGLNRVTGEAILGIGRGAKIFEKLGLEAKDSEGKVKSFDTLLMEVAENMKGLSRQEAVAMAEKLGIDRSLVPLLLKGKEGISALREEARAFGIVTGEEAEQAGLFADSLDRTKLLMKALSESIGIKMLPALTSAMDRFRGWIMQNKEFINLAIDRTLNVIGGSFEFVADWIMRVANGISFLISYFNQLSPTGQAVIEILGGIGLALLAVQLKALLIPIALTAIGAAIVLIVDDLANWAEGNQSVMGDILASSPLARDAYNAIGAAIYYIVQAYDSAIERASRFIETVMNGAAAVKNALSLGFGADSASMRLPGASGFNGSTSQRGVLGPSRTNNSTSNQSNVTTNTIHIKSTDPVRAGQEVNKALAKSNRGVSRNNQSQVVQ